MSGPSSEELKLLCDDVADVVCSKLPDPWDKLCSRMVAIWGEATPFTEGESTRLRHGTKKIALGWITPSFTNFLSFLEVGKQPPHGTNATPHPTRISRRDFNQRYQQWRQWLHLYDDVFDQTGAERLRSNKSALINCFETNVILQTEKTKPNKKKKKTNNSNRHTISDSGSIENYWKIQVALQTPDYPPDPSYWRSQVSALVENSHLDTQLNELVHSTPLDSSDYWRQQVTYYTPEYEWNQSQPPEQFKTEETSLVDPNYWRAELFRTEERVDKEEIWKTALCKVREITEEDELFSDTNSLDEDVVDNVITLLDENSCDSRLSNKSSARPSVNSLLKRRRLDIRTASKQMGTLSVGD